MHNSGQPSCWLQPGGVQVRPAKGEGSLYFYRSGEKREEFCVVVSPGKKKRKDK
jgi:hypothetical protein